MPRVGSLSRPQRYSKAVAPALFGCHPRVSETRGLSFGTPPTGRPPHSGDRSGGRLRTYHLSMSVKVSRATVLAVSAVMQRETISNPFFWSTRIDG